MPPKPRQVRIEQRGALAAMEALQERSDEELQREQKFKAAALAILGARAAERYDADASLALAERRPDDLKAAVERLGQAPPSGRQLFLLRVMGFLAPPASAPWYMKARGFLLIVLLIVLLLAIGFGIVKLVSLPFGGVSTTLGLILGVVVVLAILGGLALFGRFRQQRAKARAAAGG